MLNGEHIVTGLPNNSVLLLLSGCKELLSVNKKKRHIYISPVTPINEFYANYTNCEVLFVSAFSEVASSSLFSSFLGGSEFTAALLFSANKNGNG